MTTPFSVPDDGAEQSRARGLENVAAWAASVVSRVPGEEPDVLPGIIAPLDFRADFAVNAQTDAASVTLGNARVRLSRASAVATSGDLTLSLRWTPGYRADGLRTGDVLIDDWVVELVEAGRVDLKHPALAGEVREAAVPTVTIVKLGPAEAGDEFTARVSGDAPGCRDAGIQGWVRG